MKIAVLGSSGFLGSSIYSQLSEDHNVTAVNRNTHNLLDFLAASSWLEKHRFDVIVNCASAGVKRVDDISLENLSNNIFLFMNFFNNSDKFGRFINIGSGAEFDTSNHIRMCRESEILTSFPKTSYGISKNTISRMCLEKNNFFTLRLFGCFSWAEPEFRILKRMFYQEEVKVQNKKFDFFSLDDFYSVLNYYILTADIEHKDVNCVYSEKLDLLNMVQTFKEIHSLSTEIETVDSDGLDYTGDGGLLSELPIHLEGLVEGFRKYL